MELGTCPRCGAYVLAGRTNGYDVVVNAKPLDAQRLTAALLGGRQIYRPRRSETGRVVGLKWIRPGSEPLDPSMVDEHECPNVVVRPVKAPVDPQEPVPAPAARAGSLRGSEALRDPSGPRTLRKPSGALLAPFQPLVRPRVTPVFDRSSSTGRSCTPRSSWGLRSYGPGTKSAPGRRFDPWLGI